MKAMPTSIGKEPSLVKTVRLRRNRWTST